MHQKTISEIEQDYELELDNISSYIKKTRAKKVLLQFPDGMKPWACVISKEIEKRTKAECLIFLGTCFGACDVPNVKEVDLLIQFGHSKNLKFLGCSEI